MTTTILFGELRTGRITDIIDATACGWGQVSNDAGPIDGVTVPEDEVRSKNLRQSAQAARCFLAVDVDGVIQEAGPIWSRTWNYEKAELTLGAAGLWSLFDHRKVLRVLAAGLRVQDAGFTVSGTDLGGIAKALVSQAMQHVGGNLPLDLGATYASDRTETFPGWKLLTVGDQLREFTKRESAAPDIRFRPIYTTDRMGIRWQMECGTEAQPLLTQTGDDWYFDASVPKGPVVGINTDEDATVMAERAFVTGNGTEDATLISTATDTSLINSGFPLMEAEESRSTVELQDTLDGHAQNLLERTARPVEVWKVTVRKEAATQVLAGHYARVIPKSSDAWLGTNGEAYMRIKSKSGNLGDNVTLNMYPVRTVL